MMKTLYLCLLLSLVYSISADKVYGQGLPVEDVSKSLPCLDKNFNVRVVMTVDSSTREPLKTQAEVNDILAEASVYFYPICVSFSSCSYDVIENYSYNKLLNPNRIEEMGVVYHYPRRITLFIVNEVDGIYCGYSHHDGLSSNNEARIYVELQCEDNPAQQIAHHVGSLLGLYRTNEGPAEELADGSNCETTGDLICDTPADPYGMKRDSLGQWTAAPDPKKEGYVSGCDFVWKVKDDMGNFYNPNTTNMMSPYSCKCAFSREQFLKMVENYEDSGHLKY